ncbi:MAG: hypothetical protein JWP57_3695 [Spirosoma sp.]|nr:hypothetical protein [Spirosoma sp.]
MPFKQVVLTINPMFARIWLAIPLLLSYLLIAGTGYINAPDEPRYAVAQSHAHQVHHHLDRYSDFNAMDLGLDERSDLTVSPNNNDSVPDSRPLLKITGIDAHCLPGDACFSFLPTYPTNRPVGGYLAVALTAVWCPIDAPPW